MAKQLYNSGDLRVLFTRCRSIVKKSNPALGADVVCAFYWILRGRPIAEIIAEHGEINMDSAVFPLIQSYCPEIVADNCEQLIADRPSRLKIIEKMKRTQTGAQYYNLNAVDKDPNLPWERIENPDHHQCSVRIRDQAKTAVVEDTGPADKPKKDKPKKPRLNTPTVIFHEADSGTESAINGADPIQPPDIHSKPVIPSPDLPKPPPAPSSFLRTQPVIVQTISFQKAPLETSTRRLNLTAFLRSRNCTNFAGAVRLICDHIGLPECCDDVLSRFGMSSKGLVVQPNMRPTENIRRFAVGFSAYFTKSDTAESAARKIVNVIDGMSRDETVDDPSLGYRTQSTAAESAPGGESISAVKSRIPSMVR